MRGRATIFALGRFRDDSHGVHGTEPATLRAALDWLQRHRYPLIPLRELFEKLAADEVPSRAVAFTLEGGYLEQVTVAGPVFAEVDCPVTVFLSTGFIDRTLWCWWDRIEFVFESTGHRRLAAELDGHTLNYAWRTAGERARATRDFTARCERVPEAEKLEAIRRLARAAGVDLPDAAPPRYLPASWDQARTAERRRMTFGPLTISHPILSQLPEGEAAREIADSWRRLREELVRPDPLFCFPGGGPESFGAREITTCRAAGLTGAVVSSPGYADPALYRASGEGPYRVRRFEMPEGLGEMVGHASGLTRLQQILRD
jgi:peptidoglycan/xylan/chitin deacetylase (PgdA/CDA1 family)